MPHESKTGYIRHMVTSSISDSSNPTSFKMIIELAAMSLCASSSPLSFVSLKIPTLKV
jgi:hypothetical protein